MKNIYPYIFHICKLKLNKQKERKNMNNKTKCLCKESTIANINGLSVGDRAYCGPYGTITCTKKACAITKSPRKFKVANSTRLRNGGNWTMKALRKAIEA